MSNRLFRCAFDGDHNHISISITVDEEKKQSNALLVIRSLILSDFVGSMTFLLEFYSSSSGGTGVQDLSGLKRSILLKSSRVVVPKSFS